MNLEKKKKRKRSERNINVTECQEEVLRGLIRSSKGFSMLGSNESKDVPTLHYMLNS